MSDRTADVARLLALARTGSRDALGEAMEACRAYLLTVAERELDPALRAKGGVSDLVQETFLEAQRDFPRFIGNSDREWLAWLRQVLLNNLAAFSRRYRDTQKRQLDHETRLPSDGSLGDAMPAVLDDESSHSARLIERERDAALRQAIARLPDDYRMVLTLRYDQGCSFDEIAIRMARTANAVRKLWARAIERLQEELERCHDSL